MTNNIRTTKIKDIILLSHLVYMLEKLEEYKNMDIVFATSDLYSRPAMVTIKTLFENNINIASINIHYIGNGLSKRNMDLLQKLAGEYNRKIVFYEMPGYLNDISGLLRTNAIAYTYCFFQDILPANIEKVLLLESDTIVTDSLEEFYNTDIAGYYLAATDDLQSKYCKEKIGIKPTTPYFNSGVMLINLTKMRKDHISDEIKQVIKSGKAKFLYEVQDEMNYLLAEKVKILPPKFNCTTAIFLFGYDDMKHYRWPSTCCTREEYEEARNHPVVVHFTKNQIIQSRPWIKGCTHPYNSYYLMYKFDSPASDMELWEANRNIINKIAYFIYSSISKGVLARTLGIVHAYLYPKFLYKYILRR